MSQGKADGRSWSVARYATAFVLLVLIIFIALSSFVYIQLRPILDESAATQRNLAREELSSGLTAAMQAIKHDLSELANWDESKQQLGQPAYYAYWHDNRVKDAGVVSASVIDVNLYTAKGDRLSGGQTEEHVPSHIAPADMSPSFRVVAGRIIIQDFAPIYQRENESTPAGYVEVKMDLLKQLESSRVLLRVKTASLGLSQDVLHATSSKDVLDKLNYDFVGDASHSAVASLLSNLLFQSALLLIVSTSALYWFLHYRLGQPLQEISSYIDNCRIGTPRTMALKGIKVLPVAELEKIRKSLNDYQEQLTEMQGTLEMSNAQLWAQAHHDPMTAAYNRRAFEEDWGQILAQAQRHPVNVCFMLFDCDHFKTINDTYGHHVGDEVIRGIAVALSSMLRNDEKLYRLGGDEFACLLTEAAMEEYIKVAQRAEKAIATYDFKSLGVQEPIRISIGLAHFSGLDAGTLNKLSRQADIAMYLAKRPGNNKITVYDESMAEMADSVISSMETSAVYETLGNPDMIEMVYQPIVQLPGEVVEYYESLVRIRYKDKLITPGSIFPVVEARRLEAEFDLAVVSRVALDLELGVIPQGSGVAINISGPGILNAAVIERLNTLARWTAKYKMVVEITETALITQIGFATVNLDALRKLGFFIALDDFGSGYSSLRYLSNMPVDTVKFDISLIRSLMGEARQMVIVENLAHLIENAGYQMVAEGIETREILGKVTQLGFSHGQGFFLGKPQRLS